MSDISETRIIYSQKDIYYDTPISDNRFLDFYVPRQVPPADDDDFIILEKRHEFKPNVLAYDLYADDRLWWIFVRLNMDTIQDPIRDMREGVILRVPKPERIFSLFS